MELRPTFASTDVVLAYATDLLERVKTSYGDMHVVPDAKALQDLFAVAVAADDGFNRGMLLLSEGWVVNQDLVAILDPRFSRLHERARDRLVEAWVIRTGMRFPRGDGAKISFKNPATGFNMTGTVQAVLHKHALAYVSCPGVEDLYRVPVEDITHIYENHVAVSINTVLLAEERLARAAAQKVAREAVEAAA